MTTQKEREEKRREMITARHARLRAAIAKEIMYERRMGRLTWPRIQGYMAGFVDGALMSESDSETEHTWMQVHQCTHYFAVRAEKRTAQ